MAAGVGAKTAESIQAWFQAPENKSLLVNLGKAGVACLASDSEKGSAAALSTPGRVSLAVVAAEVGSDKSSTTGVSAEARAGEVNRAEETPSAGAVAESKTTTSTAALVGLSGLTLAVTGTLVGRGEKMTRDQFKALLEASGAELADTVTSSVFILVQGEKPGKNKVDKALKSEIPVLTEAEFWSKYSR